MKKKLEADLISIAHRILKLKNKSELDQLYLETQQLYEKLAVLKFVETHFADAKPTIGHQEVTEALQVVFDEETEAPEVIGDAAEPTAAASTAAATEEPAAAEPENEEEETASTDEEHETVADSELDDVTDDENPEETAEEDETEEDETEETDVETEETEETEIEKPSFELSFERKEEESSQSDAKETPKQISFEDFLGNYTEPVFEKISDKKEPVVEEAAEPEVTEPEMEEAHSAEEAPASAIAEAETVVEETPAAEESVLEPAAEPAAEPEKQPEIEAIAPEKTIRSFTFGLNDRIGFERNLFGGSGEDMNRVVSQLSTFDTFEEARDFIEEMVKPDYNNWEGKDDYAQRFMDIVERKFN
ncbi:MAG: hypothetical protein CFE23_04665 [Flavobacterium sp. BFFFF1]|uniref:hypothetical protein n=1 Tax=Flavobacterium sp. BFFFF1 TaxID=2015557 RepID=UPI000BCF7366|nr:hypothetical protein [Flavobacterium sp. BFFFF1]OYU81386.1 MAG: hypothetical protein CFE23_04665 [Flavobacterium sp. BFFFF1]